MNLMFQLVYAPVNLPLRIEESLLKHNEETRSQKNDPCIHSFLEENTPILSQSLRDILRLILQENSFSEFNDKNCSTKMAVTIANTFTTSV